MNYLILLKTPNQRSTEIAHALQKQESGISLLLYQDAVYLGMKTHPLTPLFQQLLQKEAKIFALSDDVQKRGISSTLHSEIKLVNYDEFVNLLFQENQKVLNL